MPLPSRSRLREWLHNPLAGRWLPLPRRSGGELWNAALSSRPARTAAIFVVLVALLAAVYLKANRTVAALLLGSLLLYALQRLRLRRVVVRARRALALVNGGELELGAALLRPLCRTPLAPVGALSYSLGIVLVLLGQHREAVQALARVWRSEQSPPRESTATLLALAYALAGALDEAAAWAEEARRRGASGGLRTVAEAVVALRRGDAAAAGALLDVGWGDIEQTVVARLYRGVRILRALATEAQAGGETPRSAELLAGARPFTPGEYRFLGAAWPEMAAYLERAGLGG